MDETRGPTAPSVAARRPALAAGIAVVVLLAVVAVASRRGDVDAGSASDKGEIGERVFDYFFTGVLAYMAVGLIFVVYLFWSGRGSIAEVAPAPRRRHAVYAPLAFLTVMAVVILLVSSLRRVTGDGERRRPESVPTATAQTGADGTERRRYEPEFAWPAFAFVCVLGAALAAALIAAQRRRGRASERLAPLAESLVHVLEETLDDLRREQDPRRAVIAAYARMESTLAAHGAPRRPAEAPNEYTARVLDELAVSGPAVQRLTDLFEWARFSRHAVGDLMKDEAIASLEAVQDELRARDGQPLAAAST